MTGSSPPVELRRVNRSHKVKTKKPLPCTCIGRLHVYLPLRSLHAPMHPSGRSPGGRAGGRAVFAPDSAPPRHVWLIWRGWLVMRRGVVIGVQLPGCLGSIGKLSAPAVSVNAVRLWRCDRRGTARHLSPVRHSSSARHGTAAQPGTAQQLGSAG